jgi:L-seryl-tRNA(Ser) seleniumtransferase
MADVESSFRRIPAIHRLLESPSIRDTIATYGRDHVMDACRAAVDVLRQRIVDGELEGSAIESECDALESNILHSLKSSAQPAYPKVINAAGVLIHTNLGRAPLVQDVPDSLASYLALEYDIAAGRRGQRLAPLRDRLASLCGAESAVMVNNNAAALLLILAAHARHREVIVSRGQLIEIGGSFRLPQVMAASGCHLVEVGCTNRTHLSDYESAITGETAAFLVAHHSNYRIVGFTTEPAIDELARLAHSYELPLLVDQGSGNLYDLRRWGLGGDEPTVTSLLTAGADLVCFSGDKLLGGPQAGIVAGLRRWVDPLASHPMYRALRPDKTALVLMDQTLRAHLSGHLERIPLFRMLEVSIETLQKRARRLGARLRRQGIPARGQATRAALGGGTTPEETIASYGIAVTGGQRLLDALRTVSPPVIGRIEDDRVILDLRAVFPDQDRDLEDALVAAYGKLETHEAGR